MYKSISCSVEEHRLLCENAITMRICENIINIDSQAKQVLIEYSKKVWLLNSGPKRRTDLSSAKYTTLKQTNKKKL